MAAVDAPNMNYAWCGLLVEELVRLEVAGFVLSPGSRNAPLVVSVARNERARHWMHFDERGAAFFALGLAKASGRPAVLICTSGSATANYWPAVVEAAADRIPLIILTADRPPELLDCGANQAIDQTQLFGNYARWYTALPCPTSAIEPAYVLTTIDQAWHRSQRPMAGPVHINVALREPLDPKEDESVPKRYFKPLRSWLESVAPYTRYTRCEATLPDSERDRLVETLREAKHGLLVVGRLDNPRERDAAHRLAVALGWPVLTDVTAGLRGLSDLLELEEACSDLLLDSLDRKNNPDCILHLGGGLIAKFLLTLLENVHPRYIHVCDTPQRLDPSHRVTEHISIPVDAFCSCLCDVLPPRQSSPPKGAELLPRLGGMLSETKVAMLLGTLLPSGSLLFAGNSMPVRLVNGGFRATAKDVYIAANRGASGIDGNIATALGMGVAHGGPTTILVGDLTALHDLNSLALARVATAPVVIVVLNNDGGGIFHKLHIARAEEPCFEACFGTPHGMNFAGAASMFGLDHVVPKTCAEFSEAYSRALLNGKATLIEVQTNRYEVDNVLRGTPGFDVSLKLNQNAGKPLQKDRLDFWLNRGSNRVNFFMEHGDEYSWPAALRPATLSGTAGQPPLLLLHGFMGNCDDWNAIADALGDTHHVLGVNLPGHGPGWENFPVDGYGMAEIAGGLHHHLDAMKVGPCSVLGYSMGGRVALYLAALFPERYTRVVLESASPGLDTQAKRQARMSHDMEMADRLVNMEPGSAEFRAFLEEWYAMPLFESLAARPDLRDNLIERRFASNHPAQLAYSLLGLGTGSQPNMWPYLKHYRPPTLLAVGDKDRKFRTIAEDMCAQCPAMAIQEFPDCGHNVHLENPDAFLTVVRAFLKSAG